MRGLLLFCIEVWLTECVSVPLSIVGTLQFDTVVNSLTTAFDWGSSKSCVDCAYATASTSSGVSPELIALDLMNLKVNSRVSLATPECPNFRSVGVARLTLESEVEDTIYVAQANAKSDGDKIYPINANCSGRVLLVSSKSGQVTGTLNDKFPGRFDGTNFLDIAFGEDEVQIVGDRYLYGWCPLCEPVIFSVADFGCGPLRWGIPDQFVTDNGEPSGAFLAFRNGFVAGVFAGNADVPMTPSYGRPNNSVAIGDALFATAVASISYQQGPVPPWPPHIEYFSEFSLVRSRDVFKTKVIYLGRNTSIPPFDQYMFGPDSRGILDTYQDNGAAYWIAYKTKGTKGEGPPVLVRIDFTFPTYQFGSVLEFDPTVVAINDIALIDSDPNHVYIAVTLSSGKGQILKILTGTKSTRPTPRVPRKLRFFGQS